MMICRSPAMTRGKIHEAAKIGDDALAADLIAGGVNVNVKDSSWYA